MKKFQKGDRVIIIGKSLGCILEESNVYKNGKGIGYVIDTNYNYNQAGDLCIVVNDKKGKYIGDFFAPKDLELFDAPTKVIDGLFDDMIDNL